MSSIQTTAARARQSPGAQPTLLAIGFAVLIAISAASVWLAARSNDDSDMVVHTLEVQNRLSLILLNLRRAESAQRGFGITNQLSYLTEYRESAGNVPGVLESARSAVSDNPVQVDRLNQVAPLVAEKLEEMQRVLDLFEKGSATEAQQAIKAGAGRNLMEAIRQQILVMLNSERELLDIRRADSTRTNAYLMTATLIGSAIIVIIGAISLYLVQRTLRQREEARRAVEFSNDNLEKTIAERTADLRLANEEIQRFAYIVSHDLRSPLVNVMGFTSEIETIKKDTFEQLAALRKDDVEATKKDVEMSRDFDESLEFIKSSIGKMDRLINSILKLSREGTRTFHPEYVSMDGLVKSITDNVAHQAAEKDIEIIVESLPPLKSDRLALEQIFSNLVDNALKYTQPGRAGRIRVGGRNSQTQVIYEVEDNGRGIAAEDHDRIFDLFRRAGQQDQRGEGIGLAHVRALVRRLGGYMTLRSELGEGSTFIITLPRHMQETEGKAA
ncbi:MAG: CHASE3 domain-containing protein [Pseudorhodoplanes sp.]